MTDLTTEKINLYVHKKVKKNESDIGKSFNNLLNKLSNIVNLQGCKTKMHFYMH